MKIWRKLQYLLFVFLLVCAIFTSLDWQKGQLTIDTPINAAEVACNDILIRHTSARSNYSIDITSQIGDFISKYDYVDRGKNTSPFGRTKDEIIPILKKNNFSIADITSSYKQPIKYEQVLFSQSNTTGTKTDWCNITLFIKDKKITDWKVEVSRVLN